jgi:hypothetical protein
VSVSSVNGVSDHEKKCVFVTTNNQKKMGNASYVSSLYCFNYSNTCSTFCPTHTTGYNILVPIDSSISCELRLIKQKSQPF